MKLIMKPKHKKLKKSQPLGNLKTQFLVKEEIKTKILL